MYIIVQSCIVKFLLPGVFAWPAWNNSILNGALTTKTTGTVQRNFIYILPYMQYAQGIQALHVICTGYPTEYRLAQ